MIHFYKGLQSPVAAVLCPYSSIDINEIPRESVNAE